MKTTEFPQNANFYLGLLRIQKLGIQLSMTLERNYEKSLQCRNDQLNRFYKEHTESTQILLDHPKQNVALPILAIEKGFRVKNLAVVGNSGFMWSIACQLESTNRAASPSPQLFLRDQQQSQHIILTNASPSLRQWRDSLSSREKRAKSQVIINQKISKLGFK